MKIQMGDYISIEGLTVDQIRNAINKFEDAGFNPNHCEVPGIILKCPHLKWLGVDTESDIMALEILSLFGTERRCFDYDQLIDVSPSCAAASDSSRNDTFIGVNSTGEGVEYKFSKLGTDGVMNLNTDPLPLVVVDTVSETFPKQDRYKDLSGESDYLDRTMETMTPEEFRGAMMWTIGKYLDRLGKKDSIKHEVYKIADYAQRWLSYEEKRGGDK